MHSLILVLQIEKLPHDPNFVSLVNDAFWRDMPSHIYRGFTILPPPFKPIHDIAVRMKKWYISDFCSIVFQNIGLVRLDKRNEGGVFLLRELEFFRFRYDNFFVGPDDTQIK